ncbi:MAG TPA: sensor histidine kinase, partial [Candidatus Binatus sp.]|nr:sensor histidine kinase [Candidatus Binatus sp.]
VISGFATALRDGTATGDAAGAAAKAIEEEAGRLERLVGELGEIERLRAAGAGGIAPRQGADIDVGAGGPAVVAGLRPEALEAVAILGATGERFGARAARADVELAVGPPPAGVDPAFVADELAVERMLGNLVDNALAATPAGGHVRLEARAAAVGARPAIAIDVIDDGPGFPAGQADRAFERFWRGEPSRAGGGSGLGLAIVRELARAHGGDAHAENIEPHGARVGVVLPRG